MNIAIFTPNKNPYSETFIQAHKKYLKGTVFYYYGTGLQMQLEGEGPLGTKASRQAKRLLQKVSGGDTPLWYQEVAASLKKHKIDVILAQYGTHAHAILPAIAPTGIPMVVHFHGYDASVGAVIERCDNYKELFAYASAVIAVSTPMERMLLEVGCPKEKLHYNVYGPQPEFAEVVPKFAKKQLIGIGRFTDKKAPYYTLMAFQKVLQTHPDARLIIAGDGVLLNTCQNLVRSLELENNVTLPGVIKPEQYREYLEDSFAFVQHSIRAANGDMEGTPLAVLEASTAGLPVISTFHAGISDVIVDKETGLLCQEHDVDQMAAHMTTILNSEDLAREMGSNGKERIREHFSLDRHISVLQEILTQAAAQS